MQPGTERLSSASYSAHPAVPGQLALELIQDDRRQEQCETPHESGNRESDASGNRSIHSASSKDRDVAFITLLNEVLADYLFELDAERMGSGELTECG